MELPIGMLIYKAQRFSDSEATLTGIWYFKEMYVPRTLEEKLQSSNDLKRKRCTVLTLSGSYDQICEVLMQSDIYMEGNESQVTAYTKMLDKLIHSQEKPVLFDEIFAIKGTSLSVDTNVTVDGEMDEVTEKIQAWKPVDIKISEGWSYFNVLRGI